MPLSDGPVSLYNHHNHLLGQAVVEDLADQPSVDIQKILNNAQDEFQEALKAAFKPFPDDATDGQILDAVNQAYSNANVLPKILTLFTEEFTRQLHERLLPLAEDCARRTMADGELMADLEEFSRAQRKTMAEEITKNIRGGK